MAESECPMPMKMNSKYEEARAGPRSKFGGCKHGRRRMTADFVPGVSTGVTRVKDFVGIRLRMSRVSSTENRAKNKNSART